MRSFGVRITLAGLVVGVLVWASPSGALASPVEGPAWWAECPAELNPHHRCEPTPGSPLPYLEPSALGATKASFVGYVKPIAGAPVTHWRIGLRGPYCLENPEVPRSPVIYKCDGPEVAATLASGEIVGGNSEEYVSVTGSTSSALEPLEFQPEGDFGWTRVDEPLELAPGLIYLVRLTEQELTAEENPTGSIPQTWGMEEIKILTAPSEPTIGAKAHREKVKQEREEKRRKKAEERKRKREERKHRG